MKDKSSSRPSSRFTSSLNYEFFLCLCQCSDLESALSRHRPTARQLSTGLPVNVQCQKSHFISCNLVLQKETFNNSIALQLLRQCFPVFNTMFASRLLMYNVFFFFVKYISHVSHHICFLVNYCFFF